jgi:hypothetical protein
MDEAIAGKRRYLMEYELLSDEHYVNRPEDPEEAFVYLEAACRRAMNRMISQETAHSFDVAIRLEYMATVAAAAEELGIPNLTFPSGYDDPIDGFPYFSRLTSMAVTRLRLRRAKSSPPASVRLSNRTRGLIELQICRLEALVTQSDLPPGRQSAVLSKLAALRAEIYETRTGFAKVMVILSGLSLSLAAGTSFLADAPDALTTIQSLIGKDKAAEDAEAERLGPPPQRLAIEDHRQTTTKSSGGGFGRFHDDLDDDLPF